MISGHFVSWLASAAAAGSRHTDAAVGPEKFWSFGHSQKETDAECPLES